MKPQHFFLVFWAVIGIVLLNAAVLAAPITFQFAGAVTQLPTLAPPDPFGGIIIDTGTPFEGQFTTDSASLDGAPDAQQGVYYSAGFPFGLTVSFGNPGLLTIFAEEVSIGISNDFPGSDFYTVFSPASSHAGLDISFVLADLNSTVFDSDAQPTSVFDIGAFEIRDFSVMGSVVDPNSGEIIPIEIVGSIDSLSGPTTVPEPGTLVIVGTGLAALAFLVRKTKKAI